MKTKDQQLLEEAYQQILTEQLRLIEEGKITDFLKKLGKGATNTFLKAKNALTTNPRLMRTLPKLAILVGFLAAGQMSQAAEQAVEMGLDAEGIKNLTEILMQKLQSTGGNISAEDVMSAAEEIISKPENSSIDAAADEATTGSLNKANKMFSAMSNLKGGDLESITAAGNEIGNIAGSDKIEDIVGDYDMQIKADYLTTKPSLESVAKDIASEAQYRKFSLDQVKQILNGMDKKYISPQTQANLQKLISLIKF